MDNRSIVFLEAMAGIAVVGIVVFVILFIGRYTRREAAPDGQTSSYSPGPYEILFAVVLVLVVALVLIWQFAPITDQRPAMDWRADSRAVVFLAVMLAVAGLAVLAFLALWFTRMRNAPRVSSPGQDEQPVEPPAVETPASARLLGPLLLGFAFLLLCWIYVPRNHQYAMMLHLIYPSTLAVALVLLFDKATRSWSVKTAGESVREWLWCDAIVFLLFLGFLNLLQSAPGAKYGSLFWDLLHIALFYFTFWILDRKVTRHRFLVAYGYLILLPLLLLIWRANQGVATPEGLSWWATIWPFLFLSFIFFVLEVIALTVTRDPEKQVVPAIKDAVFLVIYGVLLIVAIPEAAA